MARASIEDPLKVFRFRIVIDGFVRAGFSEVSGFESTTEKASYREGGDNTTKQISAGLTSFGDLTMRRGQIVGSKRGGDNDFLDWYNQVFDVAATGSAENYRKDFDVEQYSGSNVRARAWRVYEAWPFKLKPFSDLKADASENSLEDIGVVHEGWEVII